MSATGSYSSPIMSRRPDTEPPVASAEEADARPARARTGRHTRLVVPAEAPAPADLRPLSIAGLTRHRVLLLTVLLAGAWLVFAFVRQVGDVTAASDRAGALAAANAELRADIATLEDELRLIQRQEYVAQQARAYRLGAAREVPFTLQGPLPSLPVDAPGSASVRVGADAERRSPIDAWLTILFGPGDAG